jgi:integrase
VRTARTHLETIKADLGHKIAADLLPEDIDKWLAAKTDWAPGTKNRHKCTFSRALQLDVENGRLLRNVARIVRGRKEENERVRWLTAEEEQALVEAITINFPEYLPSFYIAVHAGPRQGEQYGLKWSDVDLERKRIFFGKTKNSGQRINSRNYREVPMNKTCLQAFQDLWAVRQLRIQEKEPVNEWVFQSARRPAERLLNPHQWFEVAVRDAGIEDFRWHDLRHSFCSRLVMKGVPLLRVKDLAGHKSIQTTMRYAHLAPEEGQSVVDVLDAGGPLGPQLVPAEKGAAA